MSLPWVLIQKLTAVTKTPPTEAKAWVIPSHFSFCFLSWKTSANQVMAATNSTHTPIKVVLRKKMNMPREVE
jgi:hypothetical protein